MGKGKKDSFHLFFITRLFVLIILLLALSNINTIFNSRKVLGVSIDTQSVYEQKEYYTKLIEENPTYIDAYIELSKLSAFLGDRASQIEYLQIAYHLNPNNQEVQSLLAKAQK